MSNNYIPIFVRNAGLVKENILAKEKITRYRRLVIVIVTITILLVLSTLSTALSLRNEANKAVAVSEAEKKAVFILDTAEKEANTALALANIEAEKITGG